MRLDKGVFLSLAVAFPPLHSRSIFVQLGLEIEVWACDCVFVLPDIGVLALNNVTWFFFLFYFSMVAA